MTQQHQALRLLVQGDLVAVQPAADASTNGSSVETLSVNLATGKVTCSQAPQLPANSTTQSVLALVGCFTFKAGTVLAAVTQAQQVAVLRGAPVFRVAATQLIQPPGAKFDAGETRLLGYLKDALNPGGSGRNLFFAYNTDLTLSTQALSDALKSAAASSSIAARADRRFFWNRVMAAPLLDAGADAFVLPMIVGSISQLADVTATAHGKSVRLSLTLIARRSLDRAGTRHWRRGADTQGNAANFVETEQLVTLDDGRVVASYVQCRGSIPLLWTQLPNIKYKPPTVLLLDSSGDKSGDKSDGSTGAASAAFDAHFDALLQTYKAVSCINLVNQHGSEGTLEAAFAKESARYSRSRATAAAALSYIAFDFHKECGATNYGRLSVLWEQLSPEYKRFGQFLTSSGADAGAGGAGASAVHNRRQEGVFRTNCVDCLDRTNVVQGLLARHALCDLLTELGVMSPGESLESTLPEVERCFKGMWADHGDDLGRQYAGTGALKSGFTRTGKRTLAGLLDDGLKSVTRYYLNNFKDGHKQDALDLISGAFKVKRDVKLQFRRQHSPAVPILLSLAALGYALTSLAHVDQLLMSQGSGSSKASTTAGSSSSGPLLAVGQHVLAPLLLAGGLLLLVAKNGRMLVDRPQLCPQLANTVGYADKQK